MKLTTTSEFDKKQIETTQSYRELEKFIEYQIQFNQNVERILRNSVSLTDNLDMRTVRLKLSPNVEEEISEKKRVIGVLPISSDQPITSFLWTVKSNGNLSVKASMPSSSEITFLIIY